MDKKIYESMVKIVRIGNRAVHKAREENRRLGLPNICARNGKLYFELPDGTITMKDPMEQ